MATGEATTNTLMSLHLHQPKQSTPAIQRLLPFQLGTSSFGPEGVVEGVVSNGSGLVELTVDGTPVGLDDSGSFKTSY